MIKSQFSLDGIVTIPEDPIFLEKHGKPVLMLATMLEKPVTLKQVKGVSIQSFDLPSEIKLHYYVCHENIANCLGYVSHSGSYWLVFSSYTLTLAEYLESKSIRKVDETIDSIKKQLDTVFNHLSEMDIFFKDLKHHGIFLTKMKTIKIYDFSSAEYSISRDEQLAITHDNCKEKLKQKITRKLSQLV